MYAFYFTEVTEPICYTCFSRKLRHVLSELYSQNFA
jgi:hypothetical protein